MKLDFSLGDPECAAPLAALHCRVSRQLTLDHGIGHWSHPTSERGVRSGMRHARVLVARHDGEIVATLRLTRKKPWAIDRSFFTPCRRPIYLVDMAVEPGMQRRGIGLQCMKEAERHASEWDGDAIHLEAYDHAAGAGAFYARCGYASRGGANYRGVPLLYFERLLPTVQVPEAGTTVARRCAARVVEP